jgi:glycosyltransferase involved in cell wall biosynthesis
MSTTPVSPPSAKNLVLLGMFDLSRLDSARPIRIHNLYTALQALGPVTLLSGNRTPRRWAIIRFLMRSGLRHTRAVYVEASTSTATEVDILLLALARRTGIPILVYIPDAYQLFPELYPRRGWKVKLLDWGWKRTIAAYRRLAGVLLFPSWGLAQCLQTAPRISNFRLNRREVEIDLLPPAGRAGLEWTPPSSEPPIVIYAGGSSIADGGDLLLSAMESVTAHRADARCYFITTHEGTIARHPARHAHWLTVATKTMEELALLMRRATLVVIPRRRTPYNDLAMPVKLFDYMSFGRPLVITACRDTAALVQALESGLVVDDTVEALAQGIIRLIEDPELAARLGRNAYQAIQNAHSWTHRAQRLMHMIEKIEAAKQETQVK